MQSDAVLSCTSSSESIRSREWCAPFAKCWHVFLYFTDGTESCFRASLSLFEYWTECVTHLEHTYTPNTHSCAETCMIRNHRLRCTTFHRCGRKKPKRVCTQVHSYRQTRAYRHDIPLSWLWKEMRAHLVHTCTLYRRTLNDFSPSDPIT